MHPFIYLSFQCHNSISFSSLFLGILDASKKNLLTRFGGIQIFQFPLPRDSRCIRRSGRQVSLMTEHFQFPLPRDSRCIWQPSGTILWTFLCFQFPLPRDSRCIMNRGSSASRISRFQFPLPRDSRCINLPGKLKQNSMIILSVPSS